MRSKRTSIRRSCPSRAGSPAPGGSRERGSALLAALAVLLFALPVAIVFYKYSAQTLVSAMQDRRQQTAALIANNAVTDYMRQFSQNAYDGHYDADQLSRPEAFYSAGFSTVTFEADQVNRTVFLRATGTYGTEAKPLARKVLEALIQFQSDLVQYGTMVNGAFTVSASNVRYDGGFWTNGSLSVTGADVRFNGGPVVVNGNLSGAASVVIDGDLYYSGTSAGSVTVLGNTYNYVPSVTWPALDFAYYDAHYTYKSTVNRTIVFNSTATFTVVGGATYGIPPDGAIIYCENCNLTLRGVVSGRVTAVAGGDVGNCSSANGKITVSDDLYYVGASSIAAGPAQSFAALARNCVTFSKNGSDLLAAGIYFVEQGMGNMQMSGSSGRRFWLYGVRTQGITISPSSSFNAQRSINYDPNLRSYPPPGLPEKALLVNWNLR
ncbi:MAG: hypothetical protein HY924_07825 [Elusimicrobia bacterium]|nr:hypothetical protein [Elusimicrobiota bacterium]